MNGPFETVSLGAIALASIAALVVAIKALGRRAVADAHALEEDKRRATLDKDRILCPVTMNGYTKVLEQLVVSTKDNTDQLRKVNERLAVLLERER